MKDYIFAGQGICAFEGKRKITGTWENGIPKDCKFSGFADGDRLEFSVNGNDITIEFANGEAHCKINDLSGRDFESVIQNAI
jgi:hypothetical protein